MHTKWSMSFNNYEYQPFIPSPNESLGLLECLRVHFFDVEG